MGNENLSSIFRRATDAWRGRGTHAVTVPPMDGALHPNQAIEEAPVVLEVAAPDNLVYDGARLMFSSAGIVGLLKTDGLSAAFAAFTGFDCSVSALALHPGGGVAIGLEAGKIELRGGPHDGETLTSLGGRAIVCPTALAFADENTLLVALGSQQNPPDKWKHDLMERNASGSIWRVALGGKQATCLADGLAWPCGLLLAGDGSLIVSESWRHQLIRVRSGSRPTAEMTDIPGYPSRLAPAAAGGDSWLAVFAPRSQLVEFTLRERDYCEQMMREIDPQLWIAPSLSAKLSFLEPMQVGGLMQLGILKPWAPTRSYGLVVRLDRERQPLESFHSRADGRQHGITSCVEINRRLLATSKGGDAIVSIPLTIAT